MAYILPRFFSHGREKNCIISLTTIPSRFCQIDIVIGSLLLQSVRPSKIIVWVGFDIQEKKYKREVRKIKKAGVIIRQVKDVGPHTKLIYAFKEFGNVPLVTADDDVIYPYYWLQELITTHKKFPDCIVCHRAHFITYNNEDEIENYVNWDFHSQGISGPSFGLFATGVGGVLYPPGSLDQRVTDVSQFMKLAPYADDVWFKAMSLLKGTKVVKTKPYLSRIDYIHYKSDKQALYDFNVLNNENDLQIKQVFEQYRLVSMLKAEGRDKEVLQKTLN